MSAGESALGAEVVRVGPRALAQPLGYLAGWAYIVSGVLAMVFIFIGLWPLLGAIFMFVVLVESVTSNTAAINIAGFGSLGLGLIPLTIFWVRGSAYFRMPPREERVVSSLEEAFETVGMGET